MINVMLFGGGRMGKVINECIQDSNDMRLVQCVRSNDVPMLDSDVIIDFSAPAALNNLFAYSNENLIPAVIATTGYSDEQWNAIVRLSKRVPVFYSQNMSVGVAALNMLAKRLSLMLDDCDIDIIDTHHKGKKDSPSGTALMLAAGIAEHQNLKINTTIRPRQKGELNIVSLRTGNIVGEHEVLFNLGEECISIKHTAYSRKIYALGALNAARFIIGKPARLYNMDDLLSF